jgi:hypothetical protein
VVLETANERRVTAKQLAALDDPTVDDLIEALIAWTHQAVGDAEIVAARDQFFVENGKVFHDDSVYDARMSYFFDLLLFERALAGGSARPLATPYEQFVKELDDRATGTPGSVPDVLLRRAKALGDFRHSLFQILKVDATTVVLQDLINEGKVTATARPGETFRGLEKKTLIQGFLFSLEPRGKGPAPTYLSQGLILHPAKATRTVRRLLKTAKKSENFARKSFLAKLATLQVRHLRHRHVEPKTIYGDGPQRAKAAEARDAAE